MLDLETIKERLRALEEYVFEIKKYQHLTKEYLESNLGELWKVEHGLQLAIECVLDIGNHIIAEENLGSPKTYKEIIEILGDKKVIPSELAKEMKGIAGFRNILIHDYIKVDVNEVHRNLQEGPKQFEQFIKIIIKYIG